MHADLCIHNENHGNMQGPEAKLLKHIYDVKNQFSPLKLVAILHKEFHYQGTYASMCTSVHPALLNGLYIFQFFHFSSEPKD